MPLSEHEKRLLDEIEQTLRTDDPALASSLRSARPPTRTHTLVLVAVISLVAGVGLLIAALQLRGISSAAGGVLGFVAIVVATDCALRVTTRTRERRRRDGRARTWGRRRG